MSDAKPTADDKMPGTVLIEATRVWRATGLTPSELAQQRGELLEACKRLLEQIEDARKRPDTELWQNEDVRHRNGRHDADASSMNMEHNHMLEADIENARDILARCKGQAASQ